jgi:hypothetical protein
MPANTYQNAYANLLKGSFGDGVYMPTTDIKVGDVAFYEDSVYRRVFNVFDLLPAVTSGLFAKLTPF